MSLFACLYEVEKIHFLFPNDLWQVQGTHSFYAFNLFNFPHQDLFFFLFQSNEGCFCFCLCFCFCFCFCFSSESCMHLISNVSSISLLCGRKKSVLMLYRYRFSRFCPFFRSFVLSFFLSSLLLFHRWCCTDIVLVVSFFLLLLSLLLLFFAWNNRSR